MGPHTRCLCLRLALALSSQLLGPVLGVVSGVLLVAGCGGGGGGGGGGGFPVGVLEQARNFTGSYPEPRDVTYTIVSGQRVAVRAYPGLVQVFFDPLIDAPAARAAIIFATPVGASTTAEAIAGIPRIGYYLVAIEPGFEGDFIDEGRRDPQVIAAMPLTTVAPEQTSTAIDEAQWEQFFDLLDPVPLNVRGRVIIDSGNHAVAVAQTAADEGAEITDIVSMRSLQNLRAESPADKWVLALTAIAQGSETFNPGKQGFINISQGDGARGAKVNGQWLDVSELPPGVEDEWLDVGLLSPASQAKAFQRREDDFRFKVQAVANLPFELRKGLVITLAAGNSNMPLTQILAHLRNAPTKGVPLSEVLEENFLIVGTALGITDERYPNGQFSNFAVGDRDLVIVNNPDAALGTSNAAPAMLARAVRASAGISLAYLTTWIVKSAPDTNGNGEVDLDEALIRANELRAVLDEVVGQTGVSRSTAEHAARLAIKSNPTREIGLSKVLAQAVHLAVPTSPCSTLQQAGGEAAETHTIDLGRASGTFEFSYETFNNPDRMLVTYEGQTLFDTSCVGTNGPRTQTIRYFGADSRVTVSIMPACTGLAGTQWQFSVSCPR